MRAITKKPLEFFLSFYYTQLHGTCSRARQPASDSQSLGRAYRKVPGNRAPPAQSGKSNSQSDNIASGRSISEKQKQGGKPGKSGKVSRLPANRHIQTTKSVQPASGQRGYPPLTSHPLRPATGRRGDAQQAWPGITIGTETHENGAPASDRGRQMADAREGPCCRLPEASRCIQH